MSAKSEWLISVISQNFYTHIHTLLDPQEYLKAFFKSLSFVVLMISFQISSQVFVCTNRNCILKYLQGCQQFSILSVIIWDPVLFISTLSWALSQIKQPPYLEIYQGAANLDKISTVIWSCAFNGTLKMVTSLHCLQRFWLLATISLSW